MIALIKMLSKLPRRDKLLSREKELLHKAALLKESLLPHRQRNP